MVDIKNLTVFNEDAIVVIDDTPLFSEEEKNELRTAAANMDNAFFNSQVFRTDTEARVSVLTDVKFPTAASKYYQSLRELNVHQCELIFLLYEYEDLKQDLLILQADIMDLKEAFDYVETESEKLRLGAQLKKKEIELSKTTFSLKSMKRTAQGRKREIMQWNTILHELEPLLIKENIPLNDPDSHQKISYALRFIRQTITSMQSNVKMGTAEANNLMGQLGTSLRVINEEGLSEALFASLNKQEIVWLTQADILQIDDSRKQALDLIDK